MEKVIIAIRFKQLDSSLAQDPEMLLDYTKKKREAVSHAISMALAVGGKEMGEHESDVIMEIPLEAANIIRDIHSRIEDDLGFSSTIGVGDNFTDAKKALDWAVDNRPSTIKIYEPSMETKSLDSQDKDKFDHTQPQDVAIDQDNNPIQIKKSETDDWADGTEKVSDSMKQKVASIVEMLQSNKEHLDTLKDSNPEVYSGIVALVQSISSMVQAAKEDDIKKQSNTIKKLVRFLDRSEQETLDSESAKVMQLLIDAQEAEKEQQDAKFRAKFESYKAKRSGKHKRARDFAKETGADHNFLMKLNGLLRRP